jgi:hypothetical protein
MVSLQSIPVPDKSYCVRKTSEETIILAEKGDMIHVLDEMGTEIWEIVDGKKCLGEILDIICERWEVGRSIAESDLKTFIDALATKGIISLIEAA